MNTIVISQITNVKARSLVSVNAVTNTVWWVASGVFIVDKVDDLMYYSILPTTFANDSVRLEESGLSTIVKLMDEEGAHYTLSNFVDYLQALDDEEDEEDDDDSGSGLRTANLLGLLALAGVTVLGVKALTSGRSVSSLPMSFRQEE